MARKKSKPPGGAVVPKEPVPGQQPLSKKLVSPGGETGLERLAAARDNQPMHTCCLLCHREFKDWGASSANGLPGGHGTKLADAMPALSQALLREVPGRKLADAVPSLSQSLLGEVPLSHSSSCKSQSCGNGYPEQSSVDWDPSSFLSAHKLSGLWNSVHTNGGGLHCNHNASSHSQQADHCKTTPKHFKTMCRRPTPPGEAFHPGDLHQHSDLSVPPNSPTGLSSQHSSLVPPKQSSGQHDHVSSSSNPPGSAAHAPFSTLVPDLHSPTAKSSSGPDSTPSVHKPSPCKNPHIPGVNTQHGKLGPSLMGCNHPCNGHNGGAVAPPNVGHLAAGACRDQACKSHKMANGTLCHPPSELEEGEDEDSSSERSSCASSSTNQKDGKYCDCCYCEFFGHNAPPAAPTSRNYAEIREKLRSRLTRRKEEPPQRLDSDLPAASAIDNRDVDELLDFINSSEAKPVNSAKAAKRARHKQKKKEKAQHGGMEGISGDPPSSPSEPADESIPDGSEASRLLDWPQLELERVNSFLTSRLEEIKNTIKDSIRASFSMYDLNLDVNDFPKKAATLEGNHLLSHLNGSTDMQQIDLDLAPLSLGTFKNHLDLVNGWEDAGTVSSSTTTAEGAGGQKDVQRSQTTPKLSKLSRVHSPERAAAAATTTTASESNSQGRPQATAKSKEDSSETKNTTAGAAKSKKNKKQQQQQQQRQEQAHAPSEQSSIKPTKALPANETQKASESRVAEMSSGGSKPGGRQQPQQLADSQRNGPRKVEENRPPRHAANVATGGLSNAQRAKGDPEARAGRSEQDSDGKTHPSTHTNGQQQQQQQAKGKNKKNKNKGEKSSSAIDDVFLPKDVDPKEMDEIDREVEYFKRFCLDSAKQNRQKVAVNWSNFTLKKVPSNAAQ
ncbi:hypothetical protein NHX12_011771 [Muraenolepis orangiensis]|uniref:FAM193 C-terminal domain-containing protein n=1 Tax=Muraenolepis orangiensis TaxID=630683 RepID=A0A9Q0I613_9TELE|nr:hypothetical protein NHX12_011771 [Muraenolepis orangiensis]